ncbi:GL15642 [Drosophila persimilis]|uniref:GL15642 n=1 Tax=Drosophila persimilis TaxID=7234 RepID=B4HD18_DROPE|nr:GL15642 [Drosophila persimilis]
MYDDLLRLELPEAAGSWGLADDISLVDGGKTTSPTPRGIWPREQAVEKPAQLSLGTGTPLKAPLRVLPALTVSAPAEVPVNPFEFSSASTDKSGTGPKADGDLRAILASLVEKSTELSRMLRDARYLNKEMKELAQNVVRMQKSALHSFDAKFQRKERVERRYQETQCSPQHDAPKRKLDKPTRSSPKRRNNMSGHPTSQSHEQPARKTESAAPTEGEWEKVKSRAHARKPRPRPDVIIIEPKAEMTYAEILNLVTRNQSEKMKKVGESVSRVKRTAKGALLLELKDASKETAQLLREDIGTVLGGKVEARALTQQTRLEMLDLDEMATTEDVRKAFSEQMGITLDADAIKSLRPGFGGTQRAIICLPATLATKALSVGKVKVAWSVCRIRERNLPLKCFRCLEIGHVALNRKNSVDRSGWCFRCGSAEHKVSNCHNEAKCFLCVGKGKPHSHVAGSHRCPMAPKEKASQYAGHG